MDDCQACDAPLSSCSQIAACCADCTHGANWPNTQSHSFKTTASAQGIGGRDQGSRTGRDIGHRKTSPHGGTSDSTPSARGLVRPDREECRGCEGPVLLAELTEEDDLPLCNWHWSEWVARFLNSDDAPGCSAHLIREPHGSETGQSA